MSPEEIGGEPIQNISEVATPPESFTTEEEEPLKPERSESVSAEPSELEIQLHALEEEVNRLKEEKESLEKRYQDTRTYLNVLAERAGKEASGPESEDPLSAIADLMQRYRAAEQAGNLEEQARISQQYQNLIQQATLRKMVQQYAQPQNAVTPDQIKSIIEMTQYESDPANRDYPIQVLQDEFQSRKPTLTEWRELYKVRRAGGWQAYETQIAKKAVDKFVEELKQGKHTLKGLQSAAGTGLNVPPHPLEITLEDSDAEVERKLKAKGKLKP